MQRKLFLILGVLFFFGVGVTNIAEAQRASDRAHPRWGGDLRCTATDNGWEEHWGGHSSCGECLSRHGNCTESCYRESYVCRAVGTESDGRTQGFEGYSNYSERDARQQALDRCYWSRLDNCRVENCQTDQDLVSRRACR